MTRRSSAGLAVLAGWVTLALLGARPVFPRLARSIRPGPRLDLGRLGRPFAWVIEYQMVFNRSDLLNHPIV